MKITLVRDGKQRTISVTLAERPQDAPSGAPHAAAARRRRARARSATMAGCPTPPRIKICGITGLDDAELAVEAGAWAVGVILWPGSPRACELEQAELIARTLRRRAEVCGVFVNAPLDEVAAQVDALGLTMVQLHGEEGPAYCEEVAPPHRRADHQGRARRRRRRRCRRSSPSTPTSTCSTPFHEDLRGGTGETWDWELIQRRRSKVPLILSGGLTPENVGRGDRAPCARSRSTRASGTESAPGRKDPEKLAAFARGGARTASRRGRRGGRGSRRGGGGRRARRRPRERHERRRAPLRPLRGPVRARRR